MKTTTRKQILLIVMIALACGRVSAQTFEVLMTGPAELVTCQESGDFAVTITNNTGNTANFTDLSLVLEFVGIANASSYEVMSVSGSCGICTFNAINNPPQCIINTGLTSLANTADVSFTFKLKVLCDAKPQITDGGSLLTVNPKVILADYISSSNIAALNPWTFNYNTVQQAAPPFSISFAVTFPFFIQPSANSTSLQVNYTDWSAGSGVVTRTITYTNSGPAGGDFTGEFLFTDAMNCTELIFTTVDISIAGTALPTFNVNAAACTLSYVLTGGQAVHTGETITITEHIQFLNYQAVCLLSACVDGGHNTFATEFSWGCYGTLCRSLNQTATITNQPAPEVTLSRILPTATGGLVPNDGVWETPGVGNTWQYRVTNTGSDVAYFYNLGISSRFAESFYYVTDPSNVTFTHSVSGLITPYTTPLTDAFATTLYPGCLNGYLSGGDAPISEAHIPNNIHPTIPFVLLPGEYIDITYTTDYCCPSDDNGQTGAYSVFDKPKYLDKWLVSAYVTNECGTKFDMINAPGGTGAAPFNPVGGTTLNYFDDVDLYLDQDFSPTVTDMSAQGTGCSSNGTNCTSSASIFTIRNTGFCYDQFHYPYYKTYDANIFSAGYDPDPLQMTVNAKVKLIFRIQSGLDIPATALPYMQSADHAVTWDLCSDPSCTTTVAQCSANMLVYEFVFDASDLAGGGNCPLTTFYDFMNASEIVFQLEACCCGATNPTYSVETYISGIDGCYIPMVKQDGNIFIHCPGCVTPGFIVTNSSLERENTSYGLKDNTNIGATNGGVPATIADNIALNRSMAGDDLVGHVQAWLSPGTGGCPTGCTLSNLNGAGNFAGIYHAYLEQRIPFSTLFDLEVTSLTITIGNATTTLIGAPIADVLQYGNPVPDDEYFYDLSEVTLQNLGGSFTGFEWDNNTGQGVVIDIETHYHVNQNYAPDVEDFDNDNRFRSEVHNVMYMTAANFATPPIYNAYSLYPGASGYTGCNSQGQIDCNCLAQQSLALSLLYVCETGSTIHYFIPLKYKTSPTIASANAGNTGCSKRLSIVTEIGIGGRSVNPFPNEYRAVPKVNSYNINMPASANYSLSALPADVATEIRNYKSGCFPFGIISHRITTGLSNPIPGGTSFTFPYTLWDYTGAGNILGCSGLETSTGTSVGPQGDEHTQHSVSLPFDYGNCPPETLQIAETTVVTNLDLNVNPAIAFEGSVSTTYSYIYPSESHIIIGSISTVDVTTTTAEWNLRIQSEQNTIDPENAFVYIPNLCGVNGPLNMNTLTADLNGSQIIPQQLGSGWLVPLGHLVVPYNNNYHFTIQVASCMPGVCNNMITVGYRCGGYPTTDTGIPNTCGDQTTSLNFNFISPVVSGVLGANYSTEYNICVQQGFDAVITSSGGGTSHIEITLYLNAATAAELQFVPNACTFTTGANCGGYTFMPNSWPTSNPYVFTYDLTDGTNPYFLQLGCDATFHFDINPQCGYVPLNGISPFDLSVAYSPYCDANNNTVLDGTLNTGTWQHGDEADDLCQCNGALAVSIDPVPVLCTGGCVTLTAIATGGSGTYTYSWSSGSTDASYSECNSVPGTNTYTVTVGDGTGATATAAVSVYVVNNDGFDCCIPDNFDPFNGDFDFSNKSVTDLGISTITTTNIILINGIFTVDQNFTFDNCPNVIMGPGAYIEVLPGINLSTNASTFSACSIMWARIMLDGNNVMISNNSKFYDAIGAISARSGGTTITLSQNEFDGNLRDVEVTAGSGYTISIQDNDFKWTMPLKAPHTGERTRAHIDIQDVTDIVYIGDQTGNRFVDGDYGIYASRSNIFAQNNSFDNFMTFNTTNGIAAFGYECRMFDIGTENANTFTHCMYGTQTKNSNCNILNNTFTDVEVSVNTLSSMGRSINIEYNTMTEVTTGIFSAGNSQCRINIDWNEITTRNPQLGSTTHGIYLGAMGPYQLNTYSVFENTVYANSTYGIQVEAVGSVNVYNNTVQVWHIGNAVGALQYGIRADGCPKSLFDQNCVSRSQGTKQYTRGISLADCYGNLVSCNTTGDTEWGIQFIGACDRSLTRGNTISDHEQGLVLGELSPLIHGIIDDQVLFVFNTTTYVVGNIFPTQTNLQNDSDTYTYDLLLLADRPDYLYHIPVGQVDDFPQRNGNLGFSLPIIPSSDQSPAYDKCVPCRTLTTAFEDGNENKSMSQAEEIAIDTIGNTDDGDGKWKAKKSLYEELRTDSALLDSSNIVEMFYDTTGVDAIGKLTDAATAVAAIADTTIQDDSTAVAQRIADAETKNAAVSAQVTPELNEKAVNEIYLTSVARGRYIFTAAELAQLTSIAHQCPYTGGFAVYMARNLLRTTNPFLTFNDVTGCSGYSQRKAKYSEEKRGISNYKIYPNPTNGLLTIECADEATKEAVIIFRDALGVEVKIQKVNFVNGSMQFDITELAPAVYSYSVLANGELKGTGKIAVIK